MRKKLLLSATLTAVLLLSACTEAKIEKVEKTEPTAANTTNKGNSAANAANTETTPKQEIFKIGDSVSFNDLVITLNSVENHAGNEFQKPDEGKMFLVVDATIENKGEETETVSSLLQLNMADSEGYSYGPMLAMFIDNQLDGQVLAGRKMRGQVAFEVPKEATGLEFIFKNPFTSGQAIWSVQ